LVDSEKASMLLIMRVLSIVPLNFKVRSFHFFHLFSLSNVVRIPSAHSSSPAPLSLPPILSSSYKTRQWSGPLSRELLTFNSFLKSLSRSLRHLLESVSFHMLLRNDARRTRDDFLDIALSLPFQTDTNTGFGILAKVYLDATIMIYSGGEEGKGIREGEEASEEAREAKEQALELCEQEFVGIKNPRAEVERGFRFWDAVSWRTLLSFSAFLAGKKVEDPYTHSGLVRLVSCCPSCSSRYDPSPRAKRTDRPTRQTASRGSSTSSRQPTSGSSRFDEHPEVREGRGGDGDGGGLSRGWVQSRPILMPPFFCANEPRG
jgi:hypothetical protein